MGNGAGREIWEGKKGNEVDDLGLRRGKEARREEETEGERQAG